MPVQISTHTLNGPRTNIVELTVYLNFADDNMKFVGDAKCHPRDTYNETIGEALALSRAFQKAADTFRIFAEGLVDETEEQKIAKADALFWLNQFKIAYDPEEEI